MTDFDNDFQDFIDELGSKEQPTCNINNPDCEACGS